MEYTLFITLSEMEFRNECSNMGNELKVFLVGLHPKARNRSRMRRNLVRVMRGLFTCNHAWDSLRLRDFPLKENHKTMIILDCRKFYA